MLSKEREIFKNIYIKRLNKKDELSKKVDYGNLKFIVNSTGLETNFSELKHPVDFLDSIEKREISIEEARYNQKELDRYFKKNKNRKSFWRTKKNVS